jgi:hypothetical protein
VRLGGGKIQPYEYEPSGGAMNWESHNTTHISFRSAKDHPFVIRTNSFTVADLFANHIFVLTTDSLFILEPVDANMITCFIMLSIMGVWRRTTSTDLNAMLLVVL